MEQDPEARIAELERQLGAAAHRGSVRGRGRNRIGQTLLAEFEKVAPGIDNVAGISVWRTRFVQTGSKTIKLPGTNQTVEVPLMSVVPDAAAGVPRKLY